MRVEQDRVLDDLPREELLGQSGNEHDVEGEPPRGLGGGDEDGTVGAPWRRHGQVAQARCEDELYLVEIDRPDRRHRLELGERCQDRLGIAERRRGELAELLEPATPGRPLGERREPLDQGKREVAEVPEVAELPVEQRGVGLLVAECLPAKAELLLEAGQTARPPLLLADHGGVDEEPFPAPRGAERSLDDGGGIGIRVRHPGSLVMDGWQLRGAGRQEIVGGWHPAGVGVSRGVGIGYLGERDVLGETACREPLGGAREERQERSSARIRTRRAPREEDGKARATEGFLEMRAVLGG